MAFSVFNETIDAGADFDFTVWDKQSDETATDLTGCTATLQLRRTAASEEVALELTSAEGGGLTITAAEGRIDVHMTASQTEGLSGRYVYALEVYGPTEGSVARVVEGAFSVSAEVVR